MVFEYKLQSVIMKSAVLFIIVFISSAYLFAGCNNKIDNGNNSDYYYYPKKNVYYDAGGRRFIYSVDGGNTWSSFTTNENADVVTLGEKVLIEGADSLVYVQNEEHRRLYAGQLYKFNISSADAGVAATVTERKIVEKKKVIGSPKKAEKPKKGLGKFFDKIFGKGKKNN